MYCAITGDVVGSKRITDEERRILQEVFLATLSEINNSDEGQNCIVSKLNIVFGDEFQGLLANPESSFEFVRSIRKGIADKIEFPVELYFGIGIGRIFTDIDYENSSMIDGPAFHLARKALESAKKKKNEGGRIVYLHEYESLAPNIGLLNSTVNLIEYIESAQTSRQRKAIAAYQEYGTQALAAKHSNVSQALISKHLIKSGYYRIVEAEKAIKISLAKLEVDVDFPF